MGKLISVLYGVVCYVVFFGTFLYAIAFVEGLPVPKTIDSGTAGALIPSLVVNALLLGLFAVQHSVMARPAFKRWWTQYVPEPIERSTYVMISNLLMILMFVCWQPMPSIAWHVETQALRCSIWAVALVGWLLVPGASLLINHFDLFGTRQVWLHLKGKQYTQPPFRTPWLYRLVRHPLYVGWLIAFWATPTMTIGHLLFAVVQSAYILIAIRFEERDLRELHGEAYEAWRSKTGMLLPRLAAEPEPAVPSWAD
jgi:protein-S-isoprenylcysteine O-methyltransferase Ste14